MIDRDALLDVFIEFAHAQLHPYDIATALYRLTDNVVRVLGVDGAGVCVAREGELLRFVAATDQSVAKVEEQQIEHGQGPCQEAFASGEIATIEDLSELARWPEYREAFIGAGFRAVAGIPMPVAEGRIGALNLYRREIHQWDDQELRIAQLLADLASGYILNVARLEESRTVADQLQRALDSRVLIEQAKGVLAERHGLSPQDAFVRLRDHARNGRLRLHDVCESVIDGRIEI